MSWQKVDPIQANDLPVLGSATGSSRQVLNEDEASGHRLSILSLPPGWASPYSGNGLEFHSCHEEVFNLSGVLHFGHWRDFTGLAYLNHPPYWVHPSDEATETGLRLLVKYAGPFDIDYLPFPDNWDGVEFAAPGHGADPTLAGVTGVDLDSIPWEPVLYQDLTPLHYDAKTLYRNDVTGWITWMVRIPAGWRGVGMRRSTPAGDELYVLDGDLTINRTGPQCLTAGGYYCDPNRFVDGGAGETSEAGCIAIRWTRQAHHLVLPPLRF